MAMIRFYFDEMISRIVANKLIQDGYDVILAVDVGMVDKDDDTEHLVYAAEHERLMITQDRPFAGRTAKRTDHLGLVCWVGGLNDFGGQIEALEKFATEHEFEDVIGQIFWLN